MGTDSAYPTKKPTIEEIWRKYDAMEQRLSAPLTKRMLELAQLRQGTQVLDLATGRGEPAIPAAQRILPGGRVLGVDADNSVLNIAREKAQLARVSNLEFLVSDIETLTGVAENFFDVAFARWGLMYLKQPIRALKAIRKVLAENGVLVAAVWVEPEQASFYELPRTALAQVTKRQPDNHRQPGTFYYADANRLTTDFEAAGFTLTHSETIKVDVVEVSSDEELISWARTFGMWDALQALTIRQQAAWEEELIQAAEAYRTKEGMIRLSGLCHLFVSSCGLSVSR